MIYKLGKKHKGRYVESQASVYDFFKVYAFETKQIFEEFWQW